MYNHSLSPFNNYFQVVIRLLVSMVNLKFNRDVSHGDSWHLSFPPGRFDDRRSTLAEGHGDFTIWMSSWDLGWYGTILEWNKIWILPWDWNMISMGKRWCLAWCLPWCLPSDVDEFCWVFPPFLGFCTLLPRLQGEIHGVQGLVPWNLLMTIVI